MKIIQQQIKVLNIGIVLFAGTILPVTVFAQDYEDSPFGAHGAFSRPYIESGKDVSDYNTAFQIDTLNASGGSVLFYLNEVPVFVEE